MVYRMVIFCRGRSVRSPCSVSVPINSCVMGVRRRSDRTFAIGRDYRSLISYYILPRLRRFCLFTLYHDVVRRHGVEHGPARPRTRSLPDHALAHALLPAPGPSKLVRYGTKSLRRQLPPWSHSMFLACQPASSPPMSPARFSSQIPTRYQP